MFDNAAKNTTEDPNSHGDGSINKVSKLPFNQSKGKYAKKTTIREKTPKRVARTKTAITMGKILREKFA